MTALGHWQDKYSQGESEENIYSEKEGWSDRTVTKHILLVTGPFISNKIIKQLTMLGFLVVETTNWLKKNFFLQMSSKLGVKKQVRVVHSYNILNYTWCLTYRNLPESFSETCPAVTLTTEQIYS